MTESEELIELRAWAAGRKGVDEYLSLKRKYDLNQDQLEAERAKVNILESAIRAKDNQILDFADFIDERGAELAAERIKVATATKGLKNVLYQGHNLDCLFCGFKDKIATDTLVALQAPEVKP